MNAPVLLAQLAGSTAQTPSSPKNLKLEKPQNGQAVTVHLDGNTKLDFSDVASEKLTFVKVGEKLIILFDNQSTVTVDPVFDSLGRPLTDLAFDMGSDRTLTGEQFAQTFPITTDQSVLPAAGNAGGPTGGANFSAASVGALGDSGARLALLGNEESGGGFGVLEDATPNSTPLASGVTSVTLNEDGFAEGNLGGTGDTGGTATSVTGSLNVDFGTDGSNRSFAFSLNQPTLAGLTSDGQGVQLAFTTVNGQPVLIGYVGGDFNVAANQVFTVSLDASSLQGTYTFTLLRPLDHPIGGTEDTIDLSINVTATDGSGDTTPVTIPIGINDDTPVIGAVADAALTDPLSGNPATQAGSLGISWGADRYNDHVDGGVSATTGGTGDRSVVFADAQVTATGDGATAIGTLTSHGETVRYVLLENGTVLVAYTGETAPTSLSDLQQSGAPSGEGEGGSEGGIAGNIVFVVTLSDASNSGSYVVTQYRSLDHDNGEAAFQNIDLAFNYTAEDSDGDSVSATLHVVVADTVPVVTGVAEESTLSEGNGESPPSEGGDEMPTLLVVGDSFAPKSTGEVSLNIDWRSDDQNPTATGGAHDRSVTFTAASKTALQALGLTSDGAAIQYEISTDGTLLTAFVGNAESEGGTRTVFTALLSDSGNGSYDFTLLDNLDHTGGSEANQALTFSFIATDGDLDSIVPASFTVNIGDEAPSFSSEVVDTGFVDEEGNAGDSYGTGDLVGEAKTASASLNITWGADDANNVVNGGFSGTQVAGDRSVVFATDAVSALEGQNLTSNGIALQYVLSSDGTTLTAYQGAGRLAGDRVFAVALSDEGNGAYDFTLLGHLDHPTAGTEDNVTAVFNFIARDGDGDAISSSFDVVINDDAPVIPATTPVQLIVNGDFSAGDWSGVESWGNYSSNVTGWTITGDRLERVSSGYLGATLPNGGNMVDLESSPGDLTLSQTIGGMTNGQSYHLSFAIGEATGPYAAHLEVYWNGNLVGSYSPQIGAMQTIDLTVIADGTSNTLSFKETGAVDYSGTFLANVSLTAVGIVDEDGLANGIAGGAGDVAGQATVVTSGLNISWGSDNGNSSVDGGITGSPVNGDRAVTFDASNVGTLSGLGLTHGGTTITYEISADGTKLTASAGGQEVFHVTLSDVANGSYTFTLTGTIDHPLNSVEDNLTLNFAVSATDSDGDGILTSFAVLVNDDAPTAAGETATVAESSPALGVSNIILAFDRSGSMNDNPDGAGGFASRLALAKAAAINLLNASNADQVLIVTFSDNASASSWMTKAQAIAYINGNSFPGTSGGTDYDDATSAIQNATIPSGGTSVYFFSDGQPTDSGNLNSSERAAWESFLQSKSITSYAVGVGTGISASDGDLQDIAYPGSPLIITTANDLALMGTITPTVPTSVSGNILTNDSFGADGGLILSITVGNVTYTWNGSSTVTKSGGESGTIAGNSLSIDTGINGHLNFNFSTGVWSYNAPSQLVTNATETFSYVLVDGDGDTAGANLVISVTAVNDAPTNTVPTARVVDEDIAVVFSTANGNAISIADVDHNGGNETVTLSVLHGSLMLSGIGGLTVTGNGTNNVTVTGTVAAINAALNGLNYQPSGNYNGSDTLTIVTNDNGNFGLGGAKSDTDTIAITINPVNDAPVVTPETRDVAYVENGNDLKLLSNAVITDPDNPTSFNGGFISVTLGNTVSGDQLQIADNSSVRLQGSSVQVSNGFGGWTTIGTISSGGFGGTSVTITLNANADLADVQTVVRSLAFYSSSDNPTAADRTATITFNDGGHDGSGGAKSDSSTITVHVTPVNDAPVIVGGDERSISIAENTMAVTTVTSTDPDGGTPTYSIVQTNGTDWSRFTINAATGVLSFNAAPNYENPTDVGGTNNNNVYEVDVRVSDGNGGTDTQTIKVTVTNVNEAPVLAPNANEVTYTENGAPLRLMSAATVTDPDAPSNFAGGSISVSLGATAVTGDQLVFASGSGVTLSGNSVRVNNTTVGTISGYGTAAVTITLDSDATDGVVETVLRALAYQSTSENPTGADRTATVTFNDGANDGSGPALSDSSAVTIHVTPLNDAPLAVNDTGSATEKGGTGNGTGGSNAAGNVLTNDSDVDNLQSSLVISGVRVGTAGTSGTVGNGLVGDHGTLTLNADGTYSYAINQSDPAIQALNVGNTTTDTFTYTVRDPSGATDTAQLVITINGANDAPVEVDDTGSAIEKGGVSNGSGGSTATGSVRTNDSDVDNTTTSLLITAVRTGPEAGTGTAGTVGSSLNGLYGSLKLNADGTYTYTVSETNGTIQALNAGQYAFETFTYTVRDAGGLTDTGQLVITINGANDAAVITGNVIGSVTEASGVANAMPGIPTATGDLNATDVDNAATFTVQSNVTTTYGTFSIGTDGAWTYNLNNMNTSVQGLNTGGSLHDLITVTTADGTSKQIDITINGANDAATVSSATVNLTETNSTASISTTGSLTISDVDNPATFVAQSNVSGAYGKFSITSAGAWTYTANNPHDEFQVGQTYTDSFSVSAADGTLTTVVVKIAGTNDAPVLTVTNGSIGSIGDNFENGYSGSTGAPNLWTTSWTEAGDNNSQSSGEIQIRSNGGNDYLRLGNDNNSDSSLQRTVNLASTSSATLTFDYRRVDLEGSDDRVFVQVSTDGVNFTQIAVIGGGNFYDNGFLTTSMDISAYRSSTTTIRFVASSGLDSGDYIYIDNVNIAYSSEPTFTENGSAVAIVSNAALSDVDDTNMASATVVLTNKQAGDQLLINNTALANGSTGTVNGVSYSVAETAGAITITFSGSVSKAAYELAIEAVKYASTSENPSTVDRSFQITVNDGHDNSNTATATVNVIAVNDAPLAVNDTGTAVEKGGVANGTGGSNATGNVLSNDIDPETASASLIVSSIRTGTEAGSGTFGAVGSSLQGAYGTLTLNANGTYTYVLNDSNGTVQALNVGGTLTETFTYTVKDPSNLSDTAQLVITINGSNDAPVITSSAAAVAVFEAGGLNTVVTADVALNHRFEPGRDVDSTAAHAIDAGVNSAANMKAIVANVQAALGAGATIADAIAAVWDYLDDARAAISGVEPAYYATSLNKAGVLLGLVYADYLQHDGRPLLDVIVKYTIDGGDAGTAPDRVQSLHDNLLGAVDTPSINDKFSSDQALLANLKAQIATAGLTDRPIYSGDEGAVNNALAWDQAHGFLHAATGQLTATDIDTGAQLAWSISGPATYGAMTINATTGVWTYVLDNGKAETQALAEGQTMVQIYTATVTDEHGATANQTVTVTIIGTNDAPVINFNFDGQYTSAEDTVVHLTKSDIDGFIGQHVSDPDNNNASLVYTYSIGGQSITFTGSAPTDGFTFTPPADFNGTLQGYFSVTDGMATTTKTFTYDVTAVNDAPILSNVAGVSVAEDNTLYLKTAGWVADDIDRTEGRVPVVTLTLNITSGDGVLDAFSGGLSGYFDIVSSNGGKTLTITTHDDGGNRDAYAILNSLLRGDNFDVVTNKNGISFTPAHDYAGAVTVSYTIDDHGSFGAAGTSTSSGTFDIAVTPVNDGAASISITDTTQIATAPKVGDILQANLGTDPDGAQSNIVYHWQSDGVNISGATSSTYTLAAGDVGHKISVNVTYTDGQSFNESVTSAQTSAVISGNHSPVAVDDTYTGTTGSVPSDLSGLSYNAANGHYYQVVIGGLGWAAASAAAQAAGGYLATITSAQENDFVKTLANNASYVDGTGNHYAQGVWLGGSDAAVEGVWRWVAGPEAGQLITYANWYAGEPNNSYGTEDYLLMWTSMANGTWNDGTDSPVDSSGNFGYVIEYGGVSTAPTEDTIVTIAAATLLANDSDPDAGDTFSITSVQNATHGTVSLSADHQTVTFTPDANYNGPASFTYTISDSHGLTSTATVSFNLAAVNDAPVITSGTTGGEAENTAIANVVYQAVASDPDAGTTLTYSLTGVDAALFNISTTGAVTFKASPNYEAPADSGTNNVYDIVVNVSDGSIVTTQAVAISVTNANEAPTISSGATGGEAENTAIANVVYQTVASDPDAATTLTYSLTGADAALFNISTTGAVTFKAAPNYEAPADNGANNVYDVVVNVSDGVNPAATKAVAISVTNVNEAPTITSGTTGTEAENTVVSNVVYQTVATDPDAGTVLAYSLTGADAARFNISTTGAVTFKASPNYEAPTDAGNNNIYDIVVNVSDGVNTTTRAVAITVTDVAENHAPIAADDVVITNAGGTSFQISDWILMLNDTDADGNPLTIAGVSNVSSGTASHGTSSVTFTDTGNSDGSFDYTVSDGTVSDTGHVSVNQDSNTMTGGSGNEIFIGNSSGTTIDAGSGNDVLVGNGGNDTLNGDAGDDIYVVGLNDGDDTINESSGTDRILIASGGAALTLLNAYDNDTDNNDGDLVIQFNGRQLIVDDQYDNTSSQVESISFDGASIFGYDLGTGGYLINSSDPNNNGSDQRVVNLSASTSDNFIAGETGTVDNITGGNGRDLIFGGGQNDLLNGGAGNDFLNGGGGNDTLNGGDNNDTLVGGSGNDTLTGGLGADTFVFNAGEYSGGVNNSVDTILDYSAAQGDQIDLTGLLNGLYGGSQAASNIRLVDGSGGNVSIQVDINTGGGTNWQNVATLAAFDTGGTDSVNLVLNNMTNQHQTYTT